ncbi:trihelix transcription factor ASR3-like isoform X2 [Salvia splendens]|uniref:trihelix transcription factor ASR3-like isoform X2 n=1 Tax=Salvia splendens TaxID=180675 RepID=UPI001C270FAC|nr:trihelix transcription factor ASR3-like isoform X2 [Salvia splendens]
MELTIENQGGGGGVERDYRRGNWSLEETMILIEAKRMDDERRMKRVGDAAKPAELRWKWVEDYCWRRGCFRSQNQCNDKWDNLMRDFKKIREFERREKKNKSYWGMERSERKDSNLPSNMLLQIYEALVAVVERKGQPTAVSSIGYLVSGVEKSTGQFLHSTVHPILRSPMIPQSPAAQPLPTLARFRLALKKKKATRQRRRRRRRRNERSYHDDVARGRV